MRSTDYKGELLRMDAVIRFSFNLDPESMELDSYPRVYAQAKYIWDELRLVETKRQTS